MKHLLFIFLIFICTTTNGQRLDFSFKNTSIGYYSANNCQIQPQNNAMKVIITGADPYFLSPMHLNINATLNKRIKIRLKNRTNLKFEIFWITENDQNWDVTKSKYILLNENNKTSDFVDYTIDFSKNKAWKGKIYQIRIDPGDGLNPQIIRNGKAIKEEYMAFEYIRFLR